ncbi:hypothetical protein Hanom_Chr05g00442491 [Helianthus anomalus]
MSEEGERGLVDPLIRGWLTTNNHHRRSYPPITHLVPDMPAQTTSVEPPLPSLIDHRNSLLALVDCGSHLFYQIPSLSLLLFLLHPSPPTWLRHRRRWSAATPSRFSL